MNILGIGQYIHEATWVFDKFNPLAMGNWNLVAPIHGQFRIENIIRRYKVAYYRPIKTKN
jgi:hypothetical protein